MKKIAVITGGASGIGQYIIEQLLEQDYRIFCFDKNEIVNHNPNLIIIKSDLQKEEEAIISFKDIEKIDIAVNCAGVSSIRKPILDFSAEEISHSWQENFLISFNAMKQEILIMQKYCKGKIINIGSIAAHIGMKNFLAYSIAKASIINMTKVAAIECAEYNIRINSISPATIDTPMIRKKYNGKLKDYSSIYFTKNCGNVADVYGVVEMLINNNFMTGNDIKIDGGLTDLFII